MSTKFIDYLTKIGLITIKNRDTFEKSYLSILEKSQKKKIVFNFEDTMCATLMLYLSNLDEYIQKEISLNIISNYKRELHLQRVKTIKKIIITQNHKKNSLKLIKKFIIWKEKVKSKKSPITSYKMRPRSLLSIKDNINNSSLSRHASRFQTTWDKKEKEELENCTFHPITNNFTISRDSSSVYERLYQDKEKYEIRKHIKQRERDQIISNINTFSPQTNSHKRSNSKKSLNNFNERQETFFSNKEKKRKEIISKLDKEIQEKCSFAPKIHYNKKYNYKNLSPVFKRLFEKKKSKGDYDLLNYNQTTTAKVYDKEKIEMLYNEYKQKSSKMKKLKKCVEMEKGITFQPYVNKEDKYYLRIKEDFNERENKFIKDKELFISLHNEENKLNWEEKQIGRKDYTPQEKEEIAKRIIERLYKSKKAKCERLITNNPSTKNNKINIKTLPNNKNSEEQKINPQEGEVIKIEENDDDDKYNDKIINIEDYRKKKKKFVSLS